MGNILQKDKELRKIVSSKTNKARRLVSFYLTVLYIFILGFTTYCGFTIPSLTIFNTAYTPEDLFRWVLLGIMATSILSIIIGNALNYQFLLGAQIIELIALSILYWTRPSSFHLSCICYTIIGTILMTFLKFYIYRAKYNENSIDSAAYYDTLTKCINRRGLLKLMETKAMLNRPFFLVFLDLDNFKAVNDTLGHKAGDELLTFVANRWSDIKIYDGCTLARLGGDEFALLIDSSDISIARKVVKEMFNSIKTGCDLAEYVTTSAGIAAFPNDTRELDKLLSYADTAMYKAKSSGKNRFMFFDAEMYKEIVDRYTIERDIKAALQSNKFHLLYQPQFLTKNQELAGYEALVRMDTLNGSIEPNKFIRIAEQSGLICDIDTWVLKQALTDAKKVLAKNPNLIFSINLSSKHLCNNDLIDEVLEAIARTNYPAKNLELEITESAYIKRLDDAAKNITKLHEIGCRIALDDFGTGYSSISFLTKFKVDIVKIDKSFIDKVDIDDNKAKFVTVITQMAHLLNCKVIAEGVENRSQAETLKDIGIDILQGYYYGKPTSIETILEQV